jgi:MoxR-like ATPase
MGKEKKHEELTYQAAAEQVQALQTRIGDLIFGQEDLVREVLCCLLASGHVLITGAPGLAKTTLVRVIASHLGLDFGRIQFTPDLLPSDITGCEILNIDPETQRRNFAFSQGPVFANFILADEINRASPRTQSALLEAMQEKKITVAGKNYELPRPFMVFATQNPFESEGTFPLPEAQLDRFLLHALMSYPEEGAEMKILREHANNALIGEQYSHKITHALSAQQVIDIISCTQRVHVPDEILTAIKELVRATRPGDEHCPEELAASLWYGAGPRAGISLVSVCKSLALMEGMEHVRWRHVRRMAKPVLRHRLRLTLSASRDRINIDTLIDNLLNQLEDRHSPLALEKGV